MPKNGCNMNLAIIDLEMNQPSTKIIQIGAVKVNLVQGKITPLFDEIVNPGETPNKYITELTGISPADVNAARPITEALVDFWDRFSNAHCATRMAAWGGDINKIIEDSKELGVDVPPVKQYNLKTLNEFFLHAKGLSVRKKTGLANTIKRYGMTFDGQHHNAYDDARMTARVAIKMMNELKQAVEV